MPLSEFEPRALRLEVMHLTTRLKTAKWDIEILQNIQKELLEKNFFF